MADAKQMSVPMAIVVAGALIAGAVYFSKVTPAPAVAPVPTPALEQARPAASLDIRPITSEDHVRGPENAKVTIVEYSDLECPYCKVFHQSMLQLIKEYPSDVRWVYRHAPIAQLHAKAAAEANASECAAEQGKFWEFTDVVFAATPSNDGLNLAELSKYAAQAGVANVTEFQACVDSQKFAAKVQADLDDGWKAGLQGTPFNMVITADGTKTQLGGGVPYEQLKATIAPLL